MKADATLTESEIFSLIFQPGFSTAEKVTDLSGRGVGMDVVRRNIENLRGKVEIQSRPGQGTTFTILLPLTLAIIDGLLVGVGGERYIIPTLSVREFLQTSARHGQNHPRARRSRQRAGQADPAASLRSLSWENFAGGQTRGWHRGRGRIRRRGPGSAGG